MVPRFTLVATAKQFPLSSKPASTRRSDLDLMNSAVASEFLFTKRSSMIAVFHLTCWLRRHRAGMHKLSARTVAVTGRVLVRPDSSRVDRFAEQGRVENEPSARTLPQQPGVVHT